MRKKFLIALMCAGSFAFAQTSNPFVQSGATQEEETQKAPPDPADPVPINDYLPVLAVAGAVIAVLYRKKIQSVS